MAHYDKATFDRNLAQAIAFEYSGAYVQSPLTEKIYDDVVKYYVNFVKQYKSFDYYPVNIIPEDLKHILLFRRIPGTSIFKLCEFINTDDNIKEVPFFLLSNIAGIAETANELDLLCVQSALFTLLSDKLVSDPT